VVVDNALERTIRWNRALGFAIHAQFISQQHESRLWAAAMEPGVCSDDHVLCAHAHPDVRRPRALSAGLEKVLNAPSSRGSCRRVCEMRNISRVICQQPEDSFARISAWPQKTTIDLGTEKPALSDNRPLRRCSCGEMPMKQSAASTKKFYPAWYEGRRLLPAFEDHRPANLFRAAGRVSFTKADTAQKRSGRWRSARRITKTSCVTRGSTWEARGLADRLSIAAGMIGEWLQRPDQARTPWKTILGALGQW